MNLMDQLNAEEGLNMVPCCNELNAGEMLLFTLPLCGHATTRVRRSYAA